MSQSILTNSEITGIQKSELPFEDQKLIDLAESACNTAYAPYSEFVVGAALLLENGEIVVGSNQENAAYPSGLCAERVAFFNAATNHNGIRINKVAVTAKKNSDPNYIGVSPCGSCRQVMLEYEHLHNQNIEILFATDEGWIQLPSISTLLPFGFNRKSLD